jgi:hypothetical protein
MNLEIDRRAITLRNSLRGNGIASLKSLKRDLH